MRFDLIDLQLFVHVSDAGSITAGAECSHMTLASASERIRALEAALGVALLRRKARGVEVTAAGRTLLQHARAVAQQVERLRGDLGEYADGLRGQVRVQANTAALSEHLPPLFARFLAAHPQLSLDIDERPSPAIADAVRDGLCDIGVLSDAVRLDGLEAWPFRRDPLVLLVPSGDALAAHKRLRYVDVVDREFVGLADGSALHAYLAERARELGQRLLYRVRLRSFEAIGAMVEQGVGIAIVPQAAVRRGARLKRVALDEPWAKRQLRLCVRSVDELPVPAQRLLSALRAAADVV